MARFGFQNDARDPPGISSKSCSRRSSHCREAASQVGDLLRNPRVHFGRTDEPVVGRKKGWSSQIAIKSRPVYALANFIAAVVTSEPFLANFTMSAPSIISSNLSAASTSILAGRVKFSPELHLSIGRFYNRLIGMSESDGP